MTRHFLLPLLALFSGLTRPIGEEERAAGMKADRGDLRDDVYYGTLQEVNDYFQEMNWSDGLPFLPPTFERVSEYLAYTDRPWDQVLAVLPPAHRSTTVWHVAVNAVMAGCKPEYMPILIRASRRPVKERAFANYYANPGGAKDGGAHTLRQYAGHIRKTEGGEMSPTPAWYDSADPQLLTIPTMKPGMTAFLVTGDAARNKVQTMPGGGYATVRIELPKNWDRLMEELGYPPLSACFLR